MPEQISREMENNVSVREIDSAPSRALQRYYPWVVIGIAFLTVGVAFGARNAFAVFLVAVVEEFRWSRGAASGALMLGSVLWTLSAPVIGTLLDRVGPRIVLPGGATYHGGRLCRSAALPIRSSNFTPAWAC